MKTNRMMAAPVCMAAMLLGSGCLSYMGTQAHNNRVEKQVIQMQATQDGKGAMLAVNLLELSKGYFGAWNAAPGTMAAATIGDLLVTGGAAYLLLNKDGGGDDGKDRDRSVIQVNGDGNHTYINSGDGNQTTTTESSGEPAESSAE
jgi:hypothetical protein